VLGKQDVLLHHPFQSFQPVIDFIRCAAADPNVVAIKQTIYRAGANSELMEALINASLRGKEVTVIVELMARFDEEANINWAERLEEAGAQVVYGVVGLKTHAKMALVLRREPNGLRRYAHLGTGNYNPTTAKFYTDFGLLTSDDAVTADVNEVFIHLTSLTRPTQLATVWLAPFSLQKEIVKAIRQEAAIAREGKPGRIIAKMNSLTDESVIRALYEASNDGVRIDLIVRGACALQARRAGAVGEHQGALDRRPLPGTHAHLLLPQQPAARCLPEQRRLDEPQPVPARRDRLPGPFARAQETRDPRRPAGLPEGQRQCLGTGQRRPLPPAQAARQPEGLQRPAGADGAAGRCLREPCQ
jgi:hypothetical protein